MRLECRYSMSLQSSSGWSLTVLQKKNGDVSADDITIFSLPNAAKLEPIKKIYAFFLWICRYEQYRSAKRMALLHFVIYIRQNAKRIKTKSRHICMHRTLWWYYAEHFWNELLMFVIQEASNKNRIIILLCMECNLFSLHLIKSSWMRMRRVKYTLCNRWNWAKSSELLRVIWYVISQMNGTAWTFFRRFC